ncbi:probable cytochrome P450 12a4, mitochondrial [Stegodyphus dumicola]|uniref:probable cytochrome P450 12a4, mitochondrial n=1 Tax=Stegodyphus dumicola TaxID=202533 RepID=UPI0015A86BEC|nr:probable cytochrome P450 12a4, mitochondrial [Stegodyphus dumicola]
MQKYKMLKKILLENWHPNVFEKNSSIRVASSITAGTRIGRDSHWEEAKPFEEIPHLTMLPFIGTAWAFLPIIGRYKMDKLHLALRHKRQILGDVIRDKFGSFNGVISFCPEDLETLFKYEGPYPNRSEIFSMKAYRESRKEWYKTTGLMILFGILRLKVKSNPEGLVWFRLYDLWQRATSHTVGFLLYNLAKNPDKQQILFEEISKLLPSKDLKITQNVFNELKYLKSCMKESQRMNPVIGGTGRQLETDVVISGYQVPAGTLIAVSFQEVYRDEKYFKNPESFHPERWLEREDKHYRYAFVPFGFGTRSCIGRRLAELEVICIIVEILRNFKVEYHHEDIDIRVRMINIPDRPIRINFVER